MISSVITRRRVTAVFVSLALSVPAAFAGHKDHELPNFRKVDRLVYAGGQPSNDGFKQLAGMGVRTVLDLRDSGEGPEWEAQLVRSLGMRYISVPMRGMHTPSDVQIDQALALLDDSATGPVFVHCKRGADRTGTVVACY